MYQRYIQYWIENTMKRELTLNQLIEFNMQTSFGSSESTD